MNPTLAIRLSIRLLGEFTQFLGLTLVATTRLWFRRGLFLKHCEFVGVSSTGVIVVAASFMGAVLGYQLYNSFSLFGAEALVGGTVGVSLFRELAPVMTAIMVTGRAGAAIAAEIATMRVSEQVDALEVMAVDPMEYLVAPRVFAGLAMVPLLSIFYAAVASVMAAVIACGVQGLDSSVYWTQFAKLVDPIELFHCTVKGAAFGMALVWVACFYGMRAHGGARAVGSATRNTVVMSSLLVLLLDYILTSTLPRGLTWLKL